MRVNTQPPAGWEIVWLGEVAEVDTGGTPSRSQPEFWGDPIPWMASGEVNQRRVSGTAERITKQGLKNSNAKAFPPGTVMLAMNGQGATRGKTCVLDIEATCNQSLAAISSGPRSNNRFLFQVLDSAYERLRGLTGDGRNGLNLGLIRTFRFTLPPLPEQRAISAVLDSIDEAIERTEAVFDATERLRDSLLHELLTRGVPGWHSGWKEAPGIGTVPACWEAVRLGDVLEICRSGIACPQDASELTGTPVTRIETIAEGIINYSRVGYVESHHIPPSYYMLPGDILLSHINSVRHIGKVARKEDERPLIHGMNLMLLRLNKQVDSSFGFAMLSWARAKRYFERRSKKAVNQASLNQQDIREFPMALPPAKEQRTIATLLDGVDVAIDRQHDERDRLEAMKASTADALLTGRVRTAVDQDL